ncbi:MAG: prephenate dehydratase domain-containing protein [Pirellulaceae bacterium]
MPQHVPDAKLVEVASTAAAAALAAENPGTAAIASREAGLHHGLQVIDENIEDNLQNITRFAVIGHRESEPTGRDKTSLMFQLNHRPGTLAAAMIAFQRGGKHDVDRIVSAPNCPNEYLFFVELEGHQAEPNVSCAEASARADTSLGSARFYPRG